MISRNVVMNICWFCHGQWNDQWLYNYNIISNIFVIINKYILLAIRWNNQLIAHMHCKQLNLNYFM